MPDHDRSTPRLQDPYYSLEARWGLDILDGGFTVIPTLILRHYIKLGIQPLEMMFAVHVLSYKHDVRDPYPALETVGRQMGLSQRQVRRYVSSLKAKGWLTVHERVVSGRGQLSNEYDFAPLTAAVLVMEAEEKPLRRNGRYRSDTDDLGGDDKDDRAPRPPASYEEEPRNKKKRGGESGSRHVDRHHGVSLEDRETIAEYVDDMRRQLGDGSGQARALGQVLSLYARSGVTLERFLVEVYDARKAAQAKVGADNRWAYWYKVLEDRLR